MINGIYLDTTNGYQRVCAGCFGPFPFGSPPDPRFAAVNSYHTGVNSSYHALQLSAQKRFTRGLQFQVNYTYSHCLDTLSNGGTVGFNRNALLGAFPGELSRLYGNCDYDVRHSLNGSYVYELPFRSKNAWLQKVIGGWQISGTVFVRGGFPFSVFSGQVAGGFLNVGGRLFPNAISCENPYATQNIPGVTQRGTIQWLNPNAFQSVVDTSPGKNM